MLVPIADFQTPGSFDLGDLLPLDLGSTRNRSRSCWLRAIRAVSIGALATYESGHFFFAQTGHSHFAATHQLTRLYSAVAGCRIHATLLAMGGAHRLIVSINLSFYGQKDAT